MGSRKQKFNNSGMGANAPIRREKIMERERFDEHDKIKVLKKSNGKCARCGREVFIGYKGHIEDENLFTIDHFIPLNRGGSNRMINLVPMCFPCNEEKSDLVVEPNYLKHIQERYLDEIVGMYESYIQSFDYLSRNNILASDVYEYSLPACLNPRMYHGMNDKRFNKAIKHKGKSVKVHRASMEMVDEIISYYIGYLKKYNMLASEKDARANVLFWFVNGCIYYISISGEIQAFVAVTNFNSPGEGALRLMPFFKYNNTKNKLLLLILTKKLLGTVLDENKIPYIRAEISFIAQDNIDNMTSFMEMTPDLKEGFPFKMYHIHMENMSYRENHPESKEDSRIMEDFFDKIEVNKKKLQKLVNEEIYPPYG